LSGHVSGGDTTASTDATVSFLRFLKRVALRYRLDPDNTLEIARRLLEEADAKGLSDENLEEITGIRQNEIRRILRVFYELKIASYRRGRHPETGATRYYWTIDPQAVNMFILSLKQRILGRLKAKLEFEESTSFYRCPADGARYTFDEAFDYDFTCPRCGSMLEEESNEERRALLRSRIARLEEEIERDENTIFRS